MSFFFECLDLTKYHINAYGNNEELIDAYNHCLKEIDYFNKRENMKKLKDRR